MTTKIDVLICSYNEVENIPALLDSLSAQSIGKDAFRVIFVDNGSTDNTKPIVESYHDRLNILYVYEPRPGKSLALNTGYHLASTEYVAQTDADCKVASDWLENIIKIIESESPDVIGGPYFAYYNSPRPYWFKDEYNQNYPSKRREVFSQHSLCGSNVIWRRKLVMELGGYNDDFSIIGKGLVGGEDTELIVRARLKHLGLKVVYDPSILVFHLTKPRMMNNLLSARLMFEASLLSLQLFDIDYPKKQTLFALKGIIKTCVAISFFTTIGMLLRDRKKYPYYQNFLREVILPLVSNLGSFFFRL